MNKILSLIIVFLFGVILYAQKLSNVDINNLTPEQIEMYKTYVNSQKSNSKTSMLDAEDENIIYDRRLSETDTLSNGLGDDLYEYQDNRKSVVDKTAKLPSAQITKKQFQQIVKLIEEEDRKKVFGSYIFSKENLTFEPKLNIPTPVNYVLGQGDEVLVDISGLYDVNFKLKVTPEGIIRIPNVGQVKVAGKSMDEATKVIRNEVSKQYQGIGTGETKLTVSLGNIRSIKVSVIGNAVKPGTYTIPSLSTVFNALYVCGGPDKSGSMRNVKVFRNNKEISKIDVYEFLLNGNLKGNIVLQDGDVVKVEPYKYRVSVKGGLKNIGLFESIDNESLQDLITYAGGYCDTTNQEICTVQRIDQNRKSILDVKNADFGNFKLFGGDEVYFAGISKEYKNRIYITGSVIRPGTYAYESGLTIQNVLQKSGGLKEDAYKDLAFIYRKNENKIPEITNFNLRDLIEGRMNDMMVQRDDSIVIKSSLDYQFKKKVSISGEVRFPGTYELLDKFTVIDLISKAKGFTDIALYDSVELIKTIKDKNVLVSSSVKSKVYKFKIDKDLNPGNSEIFMTLEDGDQVVVRKIPGYEPLRMVEIGGEVLRAGEYNLISKDERVSDIIKRSGGLTNYAHIKGAFLIRNQTFDEPQRRLNNFMKQNAVTQIMNENSKLNSKMLQESAIKQAADVKAIDSLQMNLSGAEIVQKIADAEGLVGIDLDKILKNPQGEYDLILEEGDVIYIPRQLQTVRVIGEVYFPTYMQYQKFYNFRDYLSGAGGVSSKADRKRIFVLYPNGTSKSTKSFLGIHFYPNVLPGSQIIVPQESVDLRNRLTTGETISIASTTASMLALIYSIINQTLNQ